MKRKTNDVLDNTTSIENDYLFICNNIKTENRYDIRLIEQIAESKHYSELFNLLRNVKDDDVCTIFLNNYGGDLHTTIDIVNAMRNSRAFIATRITGPIYSAAPLIALQGQFVIVEANTFMMFHDYSGSTHGKGHEQMSSILNDKPHFDDFFRTQTEGFLTKKEINNVLKGQDLYIGRDDMMRRLKKLGKLGNVEK